MFAWFCGSFELGWIECRGSLQSDLMARAMLSPQCRRVGARWHPQEHDVHNLTLDFAQQLQSLVAGWLDMHFARVDFPGLCPESRRPDLESFWSMMMRLSPP